MKEKKFIIIAVLFILALSSVFAVTYSPVYIESRLYYYPKNVVDNKSQAIDLSSSTRYLTTASYNNGGITLLTSPNNLALFRISENLMPSKREYQNVSDPVTTGVELYVKSLTNWEFVHENNPTQRVAFSIDAFCIESTWNSSQNKYIAADPVTMPHTFTNRCGNRNYTVQGTMSTSGDTCSILMPYTPVSTEVTTRGYNVTVNARIPTYKRDFDICVHITGDTAGLINGYYYTTLEYSVSGYYESPVKITGTSVSLPGNDNPSETTGTITIWAYIGDVLNGFNDYSFSVSPAADTYSMVLGKTISNPTAPTYDVANVQFYYLTQTSTAPDTSAQAQKFKIYISPTSDYTASGQYRFIKMNTEGQGRNDKNTIYYDLYLNTASQGYKSFGSLGSAGLSGVIGSAGVYADNTYQILPKYTNTKTAASTTYTYSSGGNYHTVTIGEDCYTQLWKLEQDIYLKVNSDSYDADHLAGMYYSYIYLTLVVD